MRLIIQILLLTFFVFSSSLSAISRTLEHLNENHDHGFWFEQNINIQLPDHWFLELHANQYWGADYQLLWNHRYQAIFQYDLTPLLHLPPLIKSISIGPGYAAVEELHHNTREIYHWVWLNISIVEGNINLETQGWRIRNRLRGDYVTYTKKQYITHALFRYRLTIYTPWRFTQWNINPYLSNEWFFRRTVPSQTNHAGLQGGWYLNHFRVGLAADLCANLSTALYWQWRAVKHRPGTHPRWFNTYQIGLIFNLSY